MRVPVPFARVCVRLPSFLPAVLTAVRLEPPGLLPADARENHSPYKQQPHTKNKHM